MNCASSRSGSRRCRRGRSTTTTWSAVASRRATAGRVGTVSGVEGTMAGSRLVIAGTRGEILIPLVARHLPDDRRRRRSESSSSRRTGCWSSTSPARRQVAVAVRAGRRSAREVDNTVTLRHRDDLSGDDRAAAGGGNPRTGDRSRHARCEGPGPARFHDRPASRRRRRAVRRRAGDGAEAGADLPRARRDRGGAWSAADGDADVAAGHALHAGRWRSD